MRNRSPVDGVRSGMRLLARSLLVAATVVCLLSIGGAMLFAVWILVPLHWLAARSSSNP